MNINVLKKIVFILFISSFGQSKNCLSQIPGQFNDILISSQLSAVTAMTFDSTGRIFACEKAGKVWVIQNNVLLPSPLLDITEEVGNWNEHGLLGIVLHPDFLTNGYFFIFYTVDRHHLMNYGTQAYSSTSNSFFEATIDRVTRYQANVANGYSTIVPGSRLILIGESKYSGIPVLSGNHDGGALLFGEDKSLLVLTGDASKGGSVADSGSWSGTYFAQALADSIIRTKENVGAFKAQLPDNLNGKILRIDPNSGNGLPGNPFYNPAKPRSPISRVWGLGLRNPFKAWLIKGTGNPNPFYKDPGTIIIHDVQAGVHEEVNFCDIQGLNFGWPIFEGISTNALFANVKCYNLDAPNPLAGQGCQPFFTFRNLLINETLGSLSWPNPCNPALQIPSTIKRFKHKRAIFDYNHAFPEVRVPGYKGPFATVKYLGDPTLAITGTPFKGKCNSGGPFIQNESLGSGYKNCLFTCDYNEGWIKVFRLNNFYQLTSIEDFGLNMGNLLGLTYSFQDSALYYIKYPNEIHKIKLHNINLAPVANFTATNYFGSSPLTVLLNASNSTDPENDSLTFNWIYSNGGTATGVTASCTFTSSGTNPVNEWVKLIVTDSKGKTDTVTKTIFLNNYPPVINITSVTDSGLYSTTATTYQALEATATDDNSNEPQLKFAWDVTLNHNTHIHPEPTDSAHSTYTFIGPDGCGEVYFYTITLTVTDIYGLKSQQTKYLLPSCPFALNSGFKNMKSENIVENKQVLDGYSLAPNPGHNFIEVASEKDEIVKSVSIKNVLGELMPLKPNEQEPGKTKCIIDISHFNIGIYFLEVTDISNNKRIFKFLKN